MPPSIPLEILHNIALHLATDDPLRPPADLCALQAASRLFFHALNYRRNPVLWATAFRYRFDAAAVLRRNFSPGGPDYADQLREYTHVLTVVRSRNVLRNDIEDVLRTVYVMLLDNNGKNRAQLEAAGIDVFVDIYSRTRTWSRAHQHDGWPDDDHANAYALWIMWMLTTLDKLQREPVEHREHIVSLLLPFVLNPYRYYQAEAPPNHFILPLPSNHEAAFIPHSFPSAHGPYPVYVQPAREVSLPYFGSIPLFSPPPITTAAKLLYFARREIIKFGVPSHLPRTRAEAPRTLEPSPTQEDMIEVNAHRGAEFPPRVTWDWDRGCKLVNGLPIHSDSSGGSSSDDDDSKRWDCDYWRRRLCGDAWRTQPRWRPAKLYVPGSMDGLWQGRLIFPVQQAMQHLAGHAAYPQQMFNEINLTVTHQPMFMRLKEHHALHPHPHVPFPPPSKPPLEPSSDSEDGSDADDDIEIDLSMRNAWFPGVGGDVQFRNHPRPPVDSLLYSPDGHPEKVLITVDDHSPPPGSVLSSPYPQESNAWVYQTFDRQLDKKMRNDMEREGRPWRHPGHEHCEMCREREELVARGMEMDEADREAIAAESEGKEVRWWDSDQEVIERMFESVELSRAHSVMDEDEDEMEEEEAELDFISDPNAEDVSDELPRVRRATDREKIEECTGIRDIVFSGTTDRRHALAWNDFTFYGRVRLWDGLIGILRRSYWPARHFIFFYGYLVGGETFVGNWRTAATDPQAPAWESAFVMSRRKDDDS